MQLKKLERRLLVRLLRAEQAFLRAIVQPDRHLKRHQLEGVLSDVWQEYCSFSREICIGSALGATTASGVVTTPSVVPASWERASYVAMRAAQAASINAAGVNGVLRKEPTWGDSSKIGLIINALNPTNAAQLLTHFLGGLAGPKHCQTVRNAAAHKNYQSLAEVKLLAPNYLAFAINHPAEALNWTDPANGLLAFQSWLDDMRTIAAGAVM